MYRGKSNSPCATAAYPGNGNKKAAGLEKGSGLVQETIVNLRNGEQIKYGRGFTIEQALSDDAGVFLRVMKADGRTETQVFTEVDASLAAGWLTKGASWGHG